jgi:hypothetical protein
MQAKNFWVGDRPAGTWQFQVLDQTTGAAVSLAGFSTVTVLLVDPQNKPLEIPAVNVTIADPASGIVTMQWPSDVLFTKAGRYQLQLQLDGRQGTRRTTVQEILVRKLGGVVN